MRALAGVIVGVVLMGGSCNLDQAEKAITSLLSLFPSPKEECERLGLQFTETRETHTGQPDVVTWECH